MEAEPSCLPVVFLLAPGIAVLELQLGRGTAVIELAFPPVVAEVIIASARQSSPWFGGTAVDVRPSSFSPEEKL